MGNRRVCFLAEQINTSLDGLLRLDFSSTDFSLCVLSLGFEKENPKAAETPKETSKKHPKITAQTEVCATGGTMTSSPSQSLGQWVQLAGAGAFITGAILSLHHYAIGICFIAGAAAFYVGKRMRAV